MKKYFPDKKASFFLKLSVIIFAVFLVAVARFYIPVDFVVIIIALILLAIALFFDCVYIPLYFRALRYESDGQSITKHGGVILKYSKSVKYSSVQYTVTVSTPFSKHTGLNCAILFVYGGQLRMPFLSFEDYTEILNTAERKHHEIS